MKHAILACSEMGMNLLLMKDRKTNSNGAQSQTCIVYSPCHNETLVAKRYLDLQDYLSERAILPRFNQHPNIIQAVCEEPATQTIYYEDGYDGDLTSANHPTQDQLWTITVQMIDAVSAVHAAGIVHCDIKPANFVRRGNHVKLIDFGLAMEASSIRAGLTNRGRGTVRTMAPETLLPAFFHLYYDGYATDWWSLGCTIFHLYAKALDKEAKGDCTRHSGNECWHHNFYPYQVIRARNGRPRSMQFPQRQLQLIKAILPKEIEQLLFGHKEGLLSFDPSKRRSSIRKNVQLK